MQGCMVYRSGCTMLQDMHKIYFQARHFSFLESVTVNLVQVHCFLHMLIKKLYTYIKLFAHYLLRVCLIQIYDI